MHMASWPHQETRSLAIGPLILHARLCVIAAYLEHNSYLYAECRQFYQKHCRHSSFLEHDYCIRWCLLEELVAMHQQAQSKGMASKLHSVLQCRVNGD